MKKISVLNRQYKFKELKEIEISKDPLRQFEKWFAEAAETNIKDVNAMFVATCTSGGRPSLRTVLLKAYDENGFVFFTNYTSRKGNDLKENPYAALLFFWRETERQIRIEGKVKKVSRKESEEYFHSRPYDSQIAATVSNQSKLIKSRSELEKKFEILKAEFVGKEIIAPDYWGGYRVIPDKFEFWQGRENRLHDRIQYSLKKKSWVIERLQP